MRAHLFLLLSVTCGSLLAQETKPPPKDSMRVSVTGCLKGKALIAVVRPGAEPVTGPVEQGRRFKLLGPKETLEKIRAQKGRFVEVTGLVKISELSPATQGIPLDKSGRIRIGGGPPNRNPIEDPVRDPIANEVVMDVESWQAFPEACPARFK